MDSRKRPIVGVVCTTAVLIVDKFYRYQLDVIECDARRFFLFTSHRATKNKPGQISKPMIQPLWFLIIAWILIFVTVFGNGLVIFLFTKQRNLRTTTNWFIASLAVADLGMGLVHSPRYSFCPINQKTCVNEAVKIAFSVGQIFAYASVTNLCILTLDRYLAIVKPLRYVTFMTKKRVVLLIAAAWVVASLVLVPNLLIQFPFSRKSKQVVELFRPIYISALTLFVCAYLSWATTCILLLVWRIRKQNAALITQLNFNHNLRHGRATKVREAGSAKMIGIVVAFFLFCYLLDTADSVLVVSKTTHPVTVDRVLALFKLANSAVNPVTYAFHKREIKRELRRRFGCYRRSVAGRRVKK